MKNHFAKRILFSFVIMVAVVLALVVAINFYMAAYARPYIFSDVANLPSKYVVIVPGAKVYENNVSYVVRDRIEAAVTCLNEGKSERVLVSGDHGRSDYDEVNQIRRFMHRIYGTDENLIFMDHAGFSTYETMYRARDVFCVNDAIIVTQKFHTVRSVYIARKLGLDAVAYVAPEIAPFSRKIHISWNLRESLARVKSFFLVLFKAKPTYLGEQIPITGDARQTWDEEY